MRKGLGSNDEPSLLALKKASPVNRYDFERGSLRRNELLISYLLGVDENQSCEYDVAIGLTLYFPG